MESCPSSECAGPVEMGTIFDVNGQPVESSLTPEEIDRERIINQMVSSD